MIKLPPIAVGILLGILLLSVSSCSKIQLGQNKTTQPTAKSVNDSAGAGNKRETPEPIRPAANQELDKANPLNGHWQIGFKFGDKVLRSSMDLQQSGTVISGSGSDDESNQPFAVHGQINGSQVEFSKEYQLPPGHAPVAPIQYTGELSMVNSNDYTGPYMTGNYSTTIDGRPVSESWEAELVQVNNDANDDKQMAETPQAPVQPEKAPDLSGKWQVAYKASFKTIKSTMFLEQDGGNLTGKGLDQNTNERFEIDKGWYAFPKLTLVRTYKKGKSAATNRNMTFKGTVEMVNDKDYQGPYLHGETEGGGDWEAQLVR